MRRQSDPEPDALRQARAELERCCRQLVELLPASPLWKEPPPVRLAVKPAGRRGKPGPAVRVELGHLRLPAEELAARLLHHLVHWANAVSGVRDCSIAHYHNLRFLELARAVGLEAERRESRFGWAATRPRAALARKLRDVEVEPAAFEPVLRQAAERQALVPPGSAAAPAPGSGEGCWRCGENLPRGGLGERWRLERAPLPDLPRFRVTLARAEGMPYEAYPRVRGPREAAALFWRVLCGYDREAVATLFLDKARRLIGYDVPYVGILNRALVEPRGIFVPALMVNAAYVAVGHNHPTGDPRPSREDSLFSNRLREAGSILGIETIWSLVVGGPDRWRVVP